MLITSFNVHLDGLSYIGAVSFQICFLVIHIHAAPDFISFILGPFQITFMKSKLILNRLF